MDGKQLKNSILQWAIQGKLVPQNPKDEPAQKLLERIAASRNGDVSPWSEAIGSSKNSKKSLSTSLRGPCKGTKQSKKTPSRIYRENGVWYEQVGTATPKDISDEIPFEIPENWVWARWGELSDSIQYGYNAPALQSGRIKMVRISDIHDNKIEWDKVPYCQIKESEISTYLLQKNDILFARTGGTVGKSYLVSDVTTEAVYAGYLIRTRYNFDLLSPQYLKFFMESSLYWEQLREGTIATAQPNCNGKTLGRMLLPLPPLAEQKRIVAKLEQVLPLAEEYGAAQEQLDKLNKELPEALKKSILQEAIQGKLVPQNPKDEPAQKLLERITVARSESSQLKGANSKKSTPTSRIYCENGTWYEQIGTATPKDITDEIPFKIPETWAWCRLGDIFDHKNGKQLNTANKNGLPRKYITTSNLYWDYFKLDNLKTMYFTEDELDRCTATKGDLLVCEGGDVGRAAIWDEDFDICIQNHIHKLRAYTDVCTKYFWNVLYFYKRTGMIGGKGIGIQGLSSKALHNIIIPLPPLAEQKRIVAKLEQLFKVL